MDENKLLISVTDSVIENVIEFEIDIRPVSKWQAFIQSIKLKPRKKRFRVRPLTLAQLHKISKLLIPIELTDFSATGVLQLMKDHSRTCAEIVAISVTESRQNPSKALIDLFFHSLGKNEMSLALNIVLQQMATENFTTTIISARTLNVMEKRRPAIVKPANQNEVRPNQVPGSLSEAS